jgi:hypothetical protein
MEETKTTRPWGVQGEQCREVELLALAHLRREAAQRQPVPAALHKAVAHKRDNEGSHCDLQHPAGVAVHASSAAGVGGVRYVRAGRRQGCMLQVAGGDDSCGYGMLW